MITEYLRELCRITERRDGAIYRTLYLADVWVTAEGLRNPPEDHFYAPKPSTFTGETIRRRKVADG